MVNTLTGKTSARLRKLARAIRKAGKQFSQDSVQWCAVAIGNRLQSNGSLSEATPGFSQNNTSTFAEKFGVNDQQAYALNYAEYGRLRIGVRSVGDHWDTKLTAPVVAGIVDRLADKYAAKGN